MFSDAIWWHHNKSNMADVRHFENGFIGISQPGIIRFWWHLKSWCADSNFGSKNGHMLIYKIHEIQNGGQLPYWKSFFCYISMNYLLSDVRTPRTHIRCVCCVCACHSQASNRFSQWKPTAGTAAKRASDTAEWMRRYLLNSRARTCRCLTRYNRYTIPHSRHSSQ